MRLRFTILNNLQQLLSCHQVQGCRGCQSYPAGRRFRGQRVAMRRECTMLLTILRWIVSREPHLSSRQTRLASAARLASGTFGSNKTGGTALTIGTL